MQFNQVLVVVARQSSLGLAVLGGILGAAAPTSGQVDLQEVGISVSILRVNDAETASAVVLRAAFFVVGSGITEATITPPGGEPIRLLESAPGELESEQSFADEAALTAALPDGDYLLDVNQGEATASLAYARPVVPSPLISFPLHEGVVAPGPVEVRFQPCTVCVQAGDGTLALLRSGGADLAFQVLSATDASWVPSDDVGPLDLSPTSSFEVFVLHVAVRTIGLSANPDDPFVFWSEIMHGDAVGFLTGFAAPTANLCVVVNDPALDPEGRCTFHEDGNDAIFDTSGSFVATAAGIPIAYGFSVSPRGRIFGIADLDLDGDGSFESHVPVAGSLSGEDGRLRQTVRIAAESSALGSDAKLRVKIRERTATASLVTSREQTSKGRLLGARILETASTTETLDDAPRGWRLDFLLSGSDVEISDARLTLSNGRTVRLFGRERFVFEVNRTNVRLKSGGTERGAQIAIDTLALDESGAIVRGVMRYRAFGQSGTVRFR